LQFHLPQAQPVSIAAATVRPYQENSGFWAQPWPHEAPPSVYRRNCKCAGVMIGTNVYEAGVASDIGYAAGTGTRHRGIGKIMAINFLGRFRFAPLSAFIFEVPNEFLLFRVHGNHWPSGGQCPPYLFIGVLTLFHLILLVRNARYRLQTTKKALLSSAPEATTRHQIAQTAE
jgi:hypothetical protein